MPGFEIGFVFVALAMGDRETCPWRRVATGAGRMYQRSRDDVDSHEIIRGAQIERQAPTRLEDQIDPSAILGIHGARM